MFIKMALLDSHIYQISSTINLTLESGHLNIYKFHEQDLNDLDTISMNGMPVITARTVITHSAPICKASRTPIPDARPWIP